MHRARLEAEGRRAAEGGDVRELTITGSGADGGAMSDGGGGRPRAVAVDWLNDKLVFLLETSGGGGAGE